MRPNGKQTQKPHLKTITSCVYSNQRLGQNNPLMNRDLIATFKDNHHYVQQTATSATLT